MKGKRVEMLFDVVVMNPPYLRQFHLKLAREAVGHLKPSGRCVCLAPIGGIVSVRSNWEKIAQERFEKLSPGLLGHLVGVEALKRSEMREMFGIHMQNRIGIAVYAGVFKNVSATDYADTFGLPRSILKRIMDKVQEDSVLAMHRRGEMKGSFELRLPRIHGHVGMRDFLDIMSQRYERSLECNGDCQVLFIDEESRRAFHRFWSKSKLGKLVLALWKTDTHVMPKYVPYFWDEAKFQEWVGLSDGEMELVEEKASEIAEMLERGEID